MFYANIFCTLPIYDEQNAADSLRLHLREPTGLLRLAVRRAVLDEPAI